MEADDVNVRMLMRNVQIGEYILLDESETAKLEPVINRIEEKVGSLLDVSKEHKITLEFRLLLGAWQRRRST